MSDEQKPDNGSSSDMIFYNVLNMSEAFRKWEKEHQQVPEVQRWQLKMSLALVQQLTMINVHIQKIGREDTEALMEEIMKLKREMQTFKKPKKEDK